MTLRHLTIFRAVCQTESITLAAEHLNMTQPAVSLAVRELEDFYGVQLFERMNRRIYITEAGRTLLQYADTILSQYAESVQVLQEARHRGSCRFGVHVTFGETVLPSLLRRLAEQLPDITVRGTASRWRSWQESGCCCGKRAAAHGTALIRCLARRGSRCPPFWTAPAPTRC